MPISCVLAYSIATRYLIYSFFQVLKFTQNVHKKINFQFFNHNHLILSALHINSSLDHFIHKTYHFWYSKTLDEHKNKQIKNEDKKLKIKFYTKTSFLHHSLKPLIIHTQNSLQLQLNTHSYSCKNKKKEKKFSQHQLNKYDTIIAEVFPSTWC
jgi:hypothetical protein